MKKINYFLIIMIILVFAFTCYVQDNKTTTACAYIEKPENIIIYNKGKEIMITQDYKIFGIIMEHIGERMQKAEYLDFTKSLMGETEEDNIKNNEIALEFIYSNPVKVSINISGETIWVEYSNLFIPLSGNNNKEIFVGSNGEYKNMAVGILSEPDDLIALLK